MVKAGRVVSLTLYSLCCAYFFMFFLYNSIIPIDELKSILPFLEIFSLNETPMFMFLYVALPICLISCIALTIFYQKAKNGRKRFFIWTVFLAVMLWSLTLDISIHSKYRVIAPIISTILIITMLIHIIFTLWFFIKNRKGENGKEPKAAQSFGTEQSKICLAGQFLSLPLYWLSCLSLFIYTFSCALGKKTWLFDYDYGMIDHGQEFRHLLLSYAACLLACTIYAISYNNILNEKKSFFIWNLFFIATVIWATQGLSEFIVFQIFYFIISLILLFQVAFSLWFFMKNRQSKTTQTGNKLERWLST